MAELEINPCWCSLSMHQNIIRSKWMGGTGKYRYTILWQSGVCVKVTEMRKTRRTEKNRKNRMNREFSGICGIETKFLSVSIAQEHSRCKRSQIPAWVWIGHSFTILSCALCNTERLQDECLATCLWKWHINPYNALQTLLLLILVVEDHDILLRSYGFLDPAPGRIPGRI